MAEHIRLTNRDQWAEWFLIHAVTEAEGKLATKVPPIPEGGLMVTLTINGVECPVLETLRYLEKQHDEMIKREALKQLDQMVNDQMGEVWELFKTFKAGVKEKIVAAGIKLPEDD